LWREKLDALFHEPELNIIYVRKGYFLQVEPLDDIIWKCQSELCFSGSLLDQMLLLRVVFL